MAAALKRPRGQQSLYTEEIAEEICGRLAEGEQLDEICADPHLPTASTVRRWAVEEDQEERLGRQGFASRYARARSIGYEKMTYELLKISDEPCIGADGYADNGLVQKQRLQVESRKWLLSKLLPKQYGDKVTQEITGEDGGALITRIELVPVDVVRKQIEHDDGSPAEARNPKRTGKRQKP